jgi:hypothetical protein
MVRLKNSSEKISNFLKTFDFSDDFEFDRQPIPETGDRKPETGSGELACHVCGGNAGKHVHYGGQVPTPCRESHC